VANILGDLRSHFARLGELRQFSAQHPLELYTRLNTTLTDHVLCLYAVRCPYVRNGARGQLGSG